MYINFTVGTPTKESFCDDRWPSFGWAMHEACGSVMKSDLQFAVKQQGWREKHLYRGSAVWHMGLPLWPDFIAGGVWTGFCQFVQSVIHVIIRHDAAVDTSDYTWMMDITITFSKLYWLRRGRCSIIHTFLNEWHGISDWLGTSWPQSYEIVQIRLISFISTLKAQSQFPKFCPLATEDSYKG